MSGDGRLIRQDQLEAVELVRLLAVVTDVDPVDAEVGGAVAARRLSAIGDDAGPGAPGVNVGEVGRHDRDARGGQPKWGVGR